MPTQSNNSKIKRLEIFKEEKELQKFLEINFTQSLKQMIKVTVKTMVKAEMEEFRQQFEEKLSFNGHYGRNMTSSFGRVEGIPIPRFRESPGNLRLQTLSVFDQEREKFARLVEQMHLLGISQRKIRHLAKVCFGIPVSTKKVGAIYKELVEKEEFNLNTQPITDKYDYLFLDGIWGKTKGYGWEDNRSVLLCALGVKADGERKILGFALVREENTAGWQELLSSLKQRGLKGKNLKLVIADDSQGTKNAVAVLFPKVPLQTCIVHKMRNVFKKTGYKNRTAVMEQVKTIFQAGNKQTAVACAKKVIKKWYLAEPKAMASLRFNLESCFSYFSFPKDTWKKIRTTNILEREFREVRRRMKGFDNTFQSQESGERYANSILNYLNQNYPLSRRSLHTNG